MEFVEFRKRSDGLLPSSELLLPTPAIQTLSARGVGPAGADDVKQICVEREAVARC
jgi:hypothetical protein